MGRDEDQRGGGAAGTDPVPAELYAHPDGGWLYVGEPHGVLRVPLGEDGRPEAPAEWTPGVRPFGVAVDAEGACLYTADPSGGRLLWHVLDGGGRPLRGAGWRTFTPAGAAPEGALAAHPALPCLYVAHGAGPVPVSRVPLDADGGPGEGGPAVEWARTAPPPHPGLAVHPDGTLLYVGDPGGRAVHVFALDAEGRARGGGPVRTRETGAAPGPLAVHPAGACLYFAERVTGAVFRDALAAGGLPHTGGAPEPVPGFAAPDRTGLAVHPGGGYLYASTATALTVTELDPPTGLPVGRPVTLALPRR
ncbi:hypothetical protein ACFWXK_23430 [Streptomyces sp. NPDC059070]|uniref:hypothetical protein n=1 Tax=unclassified Streptomyces TaxID=2593676 RepID=UPI0034E2D783